MKRLIQSLGCLSVTCGWLVLGCSTGTAQNVPETPRIDSLVALDLQPAETDSAVIWYDDFDDAEKQSRYAEKSGDVVDQQRFGGVGKSLCMDYPKGSRGIGGRKVFFGDSPTHRHHVVRGEETFTDVYWRIYVKHPRDWTGGGPAKLSTPSDERDRLRIGTDTGRFTGASEARQQLDAERVYYCRVRQQSDTGQWSAWSLWHQPFQTQ